MCMIFTGLKDQTFPAKRNAPAHAISPFPISLSFPFVSTSLLTLLTLLTLSTLAAVKLKDNPPARAFASPLRLNT